MPAANPPERIDGPTPSGGSYAMVYQRDDGSIEIVEFDSEGKELGRTYAPPPARPSPS